MIKNTNKLFGPGQWLLNTCVPNTIEVKRIMSIQPEYTSAHFSLHALMEQVRQAFEELQRSP
jgi:hypothetical protein